MLVNILFSIFYSTDEMDIVETSSFLSYKEKPLAQMMYIVQIFP